MMTIVDRDGNWYQECDSCDVLVPHPRSRCAKCEGDAYWTDQRYEALAHRKEEQGR